MFILEKRKKKGFEILVSVSTLDVGFWYQNWHNHYRPFRLAVAAILGIILVISGQIDSISIGPKYQYGAIF